MKVTSPSAAAALALAASSLAAAQNSTSCASGVHMLVARGSDEAPGPGRMGIIADGVQEAIPGSNIESVAYPATFTDYPDSVGDGVEAMTDALTRYTQRCPDSKVVLMGYSQGGQVTINTLCGGPATSALGFDTNPPFDGAVVNSSGAYAVPPRKLAQADVCVHLSRCRRRLWRPGLRHRRALGRGQQHEPGRRKCSPCLVKKNLILTTETDL